MKLNNTALAFFLIGFTSSCISFQPTVYEFQSPERYKKSEENKNLAYHIYEVHPDTADKLFDYEDLRGQGISPFVLQIDNNTNENLIFEASQVAGMVTNAEVYKKTRPSPWVYFASELFGGTIISYLAASNPIVVGGVAAATVGHIAYIFGTNAKRKKHINNKAPLLARVPRDVVADIIFFMDTLPVQGAKLTISGESSGIEYKLPIPAERWYDARFVYVNAAKAVKAREGDSWRKLAEQYKLTEDEIYTYNEITPPRFPALTEGDTVYISKKRNKAEEVNHIVEEGQTMRDISLMYAVQLKALHKRNKMLVGQQPAVGTQIILRGKRKEAPVLRYNGRPGGRD